MKISLLGKIPKGDKVREGFVEWHQEYIEKISAKVPDASFLHGDLIRDNEGSEKVVGHDLWLIKHADMIVVDARQKIGAGTAQEMVIAKYLGKPLVSVVPKDSHHRKSNVVFDGVNIEDWVHPFLDVSSDYIADTIGDAALWIKQFTTGEINQKVKDLSVFEDAIARFENELPEVVSEYRKQGW